MTRGRLRYWIGEKVQRRLLVYVTGLVFPLAFVWRRLLFRTTFIAVSGSLGKTTTKECLALVLEPAGRTYRTHMNQNGPRILAVNILRVRPWHRYAVLEVAGAAPGMMQRSAPLLRPDVAIILNVLNTHSTVFRDLEHHAAEKARLVRAVKPAGMTLLNRDDPLVAAMARESRARVSFFGTTPDATYWADDVSARWPGRLDFVLHRDSSRHTIETQLVGTRWLHVALAILATADVVGIPLADAARSLRAAAPFAGRLQPVRVPSGAIILRDDYNASIDTVDASLSVLQEASARRRVLVMTDLSDFGGNRKQRLKYLSARYPHAAEVAVFIGELAEYGRRRAIESGLAAQNVHAFPALRPAAEFLRHELKAGDLVLIKGRTTDHAARLFFAQLGPVGCWKVACSKRILCDTCWELDITPEQMRTAVAVPRGDS